MSRRFVYLAQRNFILALISFLSVFAAGESAQAASPVILVTRAASDDFQTLSTYDLRGSLQSVLNVPYPGGTRAGSENVRGITQSADGKIYIFNGTFAPYLSAFDPKTGAWTSQTFSGWSVFNRYDKGHLASIGSYIYASDNVTAYDGSPSGIVRFSTVGGAPLRFATDCDFTSVTAGPDGLLYGLCGLLPNTNPTLVKVYNPVTLSLVRTVKMPTNMTSIAIDDNGDIFAAGDYISSIYHMDSAGNIIKMLSTGRPNPTMYADLGDIHIDDDGHLLLTSISQSGVEDYLHSSALLLSDRSLDSYTVVPIGDLFNDFAVNATFATDVPEPATCSILLIPIGWLLLRRSR